MLHICRISVFGMWSCHWHGQFAVGNACGTARALRHVSDTGPTTHTRSMGSKDGCRVDGNFCVQSDAMIVPNTSREPAVGISYWCRHRQGRLRRDVAEVSTAALMVVSPALMSGWLHSCRPRMTGWLNITSVSPRSAWICQCGLATRKMSVRPSVCLSNAWIVTKRKKDLSRFFIPIYERSFLVFREEE